MDKQEIVITDIRIPLWSMVVFMAKLAVAAIPAFVIFYLFATYFVFFANHGF